MRPVRNRDAYDRVVNIITVVLAFIVLPCVIVYRVSPQWAKDRGLPTMEAAEAERQAVNLQECAKLVGEQRTVYETVYVQDQPVPPLGLPKLTALSVEKKFPNGVSVVLYSTPQYDFHILVHDLDLPEGTVFRLIGDKIFRS